MPGSNGQGGQSPVTLTGEPPKRGLGRPKGSKNKVGKEAREILMAASPALMKRLVDMALRRPVYTERDPHNGRRLKRYPTEADANFAMKLCVERIMPAVTASLIAQTVDQRITDETSESPSDTRQLARAVLAIFGKDIVDQLEGPGGTNGDLPTDGRASPSTPQKNQPS